MELGNISAVDIEKSFKINHIKIWTSFINYLSYISSEHSQKLQKNFLMEGCGSNLLICKGRRDYSN